MPLDFLITSKYVADYKSGMAVRDIAEKYCRRPGTIYKALHRRGVTIRMAKFEAMRAKADAINRSYRMRGVGGA
jgi:IS30 family transposase